MSENNEGDGNRYGITTGKNRSQYMVKLFDQQLSNKLTDEQLAAEMEEEFPKSKTPYIKRISGYRNRYNRGDFPCQKSAPGIMILKINEFGEPIDTAPGPNPRMHWEDPERREE